MENIPKRGGSKVVQVNMATGEPYGMDSIGYYCVEYNGKQRVGEVFQKGDEKACLLTGIEDPIHSTEFKTIGNCLVTRSSLSREE